MALAPRQRLILIVELGEQPERILENLILEHVGHVVGGALVEAAQLSKEPASSATAVRLGLVVSIAR